MKDSYHINFSTFSLNKFKNGLKSRDLLPSRKVLLDSIDTRFAALEKCNIENLEQLIKFLKGKKKIEKAAEQTGIDVNYLTILRREAASFLPTPVPLDKLIEPEYGNSLEALKNQGIKNSKQLFEAGCHIDSRKHLALKTRIPEALFLKWVELCDLLRINGVGPVFAHMLHESGIKSIKYFNKLSATELLEQVSRFNERKKFTSISLRPEDVDYCMDYVKELDDVLEID